MVELTHKVQSCSPVSADRNITTTTRCNMTAESNHFNIISTVRQQATTSGHCYYSTTITARQWTSRSAEPLERTVMTISASLQYYLIKITADLSSQHYYNRTSLEPEDFILQQYNCRTASSSSSSPPQLDEILLLMNKLSEFCPFLSLLRAGTHLWSWRSSSRRRECVQEGELRPITALNLTETDIVLNMAA